MILKIGTRGSQLALAQANEVKQRLLAIDNNLSSSQIEIIPIKTSGDIIQDRNLAEIGGKGLFTKEIEEALLAGSIDMAVHSMKDMPAILPEELVIYTYLEREDPRDAFISNKFKSIDDLSINSIIGTSSARRKSQLLHLRSDLEIVSFRGNVNTRLTKLENNEVDATLLAVAGLKRIGISQDNYTIIGVEQMLPAVAQGAIGIEILEKNEKIKNLLDKINHKATEICIRAERAFLSSLEASCATPIAALATIENHNLYVRAQILSLDGKVVHTSDRKGMIDEGEKMGREIGLELLKRGGEGFFKN